MINKWALYKLLVCVLIFGTCICNAKILIITHNYNRPDFIKIQYNTFKKFLLDEYEYVVFNDATDHALELKINNVCSHLNIRCIRIPQENRTQPNTAIDMSKYVFWAGLRHAEAILYSLDTIGFDYPGVVMMIDSDMFLTKKFSVEEYMTGYDIAGLSQVRGYAHFLWAGLIFFRMDTLPNKHHMQFKGGVAGDIPYDTGGSLHYYFQDNPSVRIRYFDQDFRLFLDKNFNVYGIHNTLLTKFENPFFSPQCSLCKSAHVCCTHPDLILSELGIDPKIISLVKDENFIPEIELVLKDTFVHYQAVSNYRKKAKKFHNEKTKKLNVFIKSILGCKSLSKR